MQWGKRDEEGGWVVWCQHLRRNTEGDEGWGCWVAWHQHDVRGGGRRRGGAHRCCSCQWHYRLCEAWRRELEGLGWVVWWQCHCKWHGPGVNIFMKQGGGEGQHEGKGSSAVALGQGGEGEKEVVVHGDAGVNERGNMCQGCCGDIMDEDGVKKQKCTKRYFITEAAQGIASHTWQNSSTLYTAGDMVAEGTFGVLGMVNYVTGKGKPFAHGACWIGGRTSVIGSCVTSVMSPCVLAVIHLLAEFSAAALSVPSAYSTTLGFVIFTPLVVYTRQASQYRMQVAVYEVRMLVSSMMLWGWGIEVGDGGVGEVVEESLELEVGEVERQSMEVVGVVETGDVYHGEVDSGQEGDTPHDAHGVNDWLDIALFLGVGSSKYYVPTT
ncbi:hypothetical protein BDQ17DRAFT_1334133 [Cyathus striatus]|nr:hypothetical protein BDQ17DRAFT_1334133 [Cyathus striatus]